MTLPPPNPVSAGDPISAALFNRIIAAVFRQVTGGTGINVSRIGQNLCIALKGSQIIPKAQSNAVFFAIITANQSLGSLKKWKYAFDEVRPNGTAWETVADGRTSTVGSDDFAKAALNGIENPNSTSLYGPGIDPNHLVGTFDLKPIATGCVVDMHELTISGTTYYRFAMSNAVDGECKR